MLTVSNIVNLICFCSVRKDLLESDGSYLQGADSPVHPDSDR